MTGQHGVKRSVGELAQVGPHVEGCQCTRCLGFAEGNSLRMRHGVYVSPLRLTGRIEEIALVLREAMPHGGFHAAVQATALAGARLEVTWAALETADATAAERLEREASRWWRNWVSGLDKLGLTPLAASKLGLQIAVAQSAAESALERHVRANYPTEEGT